MLSAHQFRSSKLHWLLVWRENYFSPDYILGNKSNSLESLRFLNLIILFLWEAGFLPVKTIV